MSKKKKIIISIGMVALLVVTAYLNLTLLNNGKKDPTTTGNFFTEYRTERTTTREQELLYLDTIINNKNLTQDAVTTAVTQKMAIITLMESELTLESLIKAKGFSDVAVTMSTSNDNINVIVKSGTLTQEDVAKIYEVVSKETSADYTNVKILPVE